MSEINSIANGSFVLGQTSATNFVAGPGIKIDEPSAGTVRIGMDETVLYENIDAANNVSSADLSENLSAFSKVKIYYTTISDHSYGCNEFEVGTMGLTDAIQGFGNNGPVIRLVQFNIQNTNISVNRTIGIYFANFGTTPSYRLNHSDDMKAINKIVGVNRISGGNT